MKRGVLVLGAALLWPALAQAELDYNYAQVGYTVGDIDTDTIVRQFTQRDIEESYSGYNAAFSATVMGPFLFQGEYKNLSLEGGEGDLRQSRVGVGGQMPLNVGVGEAASVYATLNYEGFDTYFADGDGLGATVGMRWQASEDTEFEPFLGYADYGEVESDDGSDEGDLSGWRVGLRGTFKVSENFAVSADWRMARMSLEQNDVGADDADIELNEELWFSLRYYY